MTRDQLNAFAEREGLPYTTEEQYRKSHGGGEGGMTSHRAGEGGAVTKRMSAEERADRLMIEACCQHFGIGKPAKHMCPECVASAIRSAEAEAARSAPPEAPASETRGTHPCEPCTSYSATGRCLMFRTVKGDPRAVSGRCNAFTAPASETGRGDGKPTP